MRIRIDENIFFDPEEGGIFRAYSHRNKLICDSMPFDIVPQLVEDMQTGDEVRMVSFRIAKVAPDGSRKDLEETIEIRLDELESCKFYKKFSEYVQEGIGQHKNAVEVFRYIIKRGINERPFVRKRLFHYGWNGRIFSWESGVENCRKRLIDDHYRVASEVCTLISMGIPQVIFCVLDSLQGILKRFLAEAGIVHDFATLYIGASGIGKTAVCRMICQASQPNASALLSGWKNTKKLLEMRDLTLLIDDFCKTESDRAFNANLHTLGNIIQAASDSAPVLQDGKSLENHVGPHIIVTSEMAPRNVSTLNRCCMVCIDEALSNEVFDRIRKMAEDELFLKFQKTITDFVGGERFESEVSIVRADYKAFESDHAINKVFQTGSENRLQQTYAVQRVLAAVMVRCFKGWKLPKDLIDSAEREITQAIREAALDLNEEIRRTIEHSSCTVFLKPLAELIFSLGFKEDWNATYYIAESEDQFFKPHRKKRFVALNLHSGYLSCNAKTLCDILHEDYPEQCRDITKNKMIKELRRHQLIRCDSDGRVPFRWPGDEHKWIHIHVRQLFELTMPGDYLTYFEDAIQRFSTEEY